jgi:polar amino acid transport system substrate-binding protein
MNARPYRTAATLLGAALLLSACGGEGGGDDATAGGENDLGLVSAGTLTACSDVPYPPFEVEDADAPSGYSGFDIDLLQAVADGLELDLVVEDVSFDALQSGTVLAAGQCDLGASAITITEERAANLDFTDAYYDSLQSLLAPADSGITSIDDLGGMTVGVQAGTTGQSYTEQNAPADTEIVEYPSDGELWPALQAGQIDAILQDLPVNVEHANADSTYVVVEEYPTDEQYGFALAKGERSALLEAMNAELAELRANGEYDRIYDSYFSTDAS